MDFSRGIPGDMTVEELKKILIKDCEKISNFNDWVNIIQEK